MILIMNKIIFQATVVAILAVQQMVSAGDEIKDSGPGILPRLIYHPESDAIVTRNATRWDNRPLYCNGRKMVVYAGEMPGLSCDLGKLRIGFKRGDVSLQLDQFTERIASCVLRMISKRARAVIC